MLDRRIAQRFWSAIAVEANESFSWYKWCNMYLLQMFCICVLLVIEFFYGGWFFWVWLLWSSLTFEEFFKGFSLRHQILVFIDLQLLLYLMIVCVVIKFLNLWYWLENTYSPSSRCCFGLFGIFQFSCIQFIIVKEDSLSSF